MGSVVDEDTAQTINETRDTAIELFESARTELQKVFIVFVIVLVGTIIAMRAYVWEYLESVAVSYLSAADAAQVDIVARTPFDVLLMQAKIGLILGIIAAIITAGYLGRKAILRRVDQRANVTRGRIYGFVFFSLSLAIAGAIYAYSVFFPVMFRILIEQALQASVKPSFGVVRFTEFLLFLTLSFAIAAQLPLFIGALTYSEIVKYETFRDNWRYAVLGIFVFGMIFSPPDPFTLLMWAFPLIALYLFSLGIGKIVTNISRARRNDSAIDIARYTTKAKYVGYGFATGTLLTFGVFVTGIAESLYSTLDTGLSLPYLGTIVSVELLATEATLSQVWTSIQVGTLVGGIILFTQLVSILREPVVQPLYAGARMDPEEIDLSQLDVNEVKQAPDATFAALSEDDAVQLARDSMESNPEKAELILNRWEEVQQESEEDTTTSDGQETEEEDEDLLRDTAAGVVDAFSEDRTTEDDIGGYLYDIQFIANSLRSRMFVLFGVFLGVFLAAFSYFYYRGIGDVMSQFTSRVPEEQFQPGAGDAPTASIDYVVALHPVEVLIFIVKFSGILAIIATLPLLLYYAWPAIQNRGFVSTEGDRRGFLVWGATLLGIILGGTVLGFVYIAPVTVSYLVTDALESGVVISYRIRNLLWFVFFLTIGIGLFFAIPVSVLIFHYTGIASFEWMYETWRPIIVGLLILGALLTPGSIITMLLLVIPLIIAYSIGVGLLWVLTYPSRARNVDAQTS
ncbi:twin-arginine translocase subunit TatC [Salinarchaeum sp. IM2453]|uniref:twin-arginine translocase subunit TatC n=1 Tax=Salinarchaeum sp. IM2453 TaxID=2862870 RepID=UPI001C839B7C|nr:twin-arginine translocase subunit TatC [Salinarchaeum sp. IM2453]QZA89292.1 twin-arginine translocase subunit TatC [Salinarchaeum sp. IM2453]